MSLRFLRQDEPPPPPGRSKDGTHTVENLGTKNLFGLDTIGTRQTTTIPQGTVGNDRPIQIVLEFWHSRGLVLTWNRFAPTPDWERRSSRLRNWIR
jgi:hypothetical protein